MRLNLIAVLGAATLPLLASCGGDVETQRTGPQLPLGADAGTGPSTPISTDLSQPPAPPPPPPTTPPTTPPNPASPCDPEENFFEGACYSAPGFKWLTFETAKQICASRGAQVASIGSKAVNDFVFSLLPPLNQQAWIGLNRTGGTFGWIDGAPVGFQNWAPGEPNNETGNEGCAIMWGPHLDSHPDWQGRWNDLECEGKVDTVICRRLP